MSGFRQEVLLGVLCLLFHLVLRRLFFVLEELRIGYLCEYFYGIEKTLIVLY